MDGTSYIHNTWKDVEPTQKPRTSVLFDNHGKVQCIGNQAQTQYITSMSNDGWKLFERFKMSLFGMLCARIIITQYMYQTNCLYALINQNIIETPTWKSDLKTVQQQIKKVDLMVNTIPSSNDPKLYELSETVFMAQLRFLKEQAAAFMKKNFKRKRKIKYDEKTFTDVQWILTVPAIWSDKAKQQMKDWAIKAELITGNIKNQLKIVYEPVCNHYVIISLSSL